MKWIGQHIWDFISRFRSDVYLESVSDGTVADDKFLGLDTNGKVVREVVTGGATLTQEQVEDYAGALIATGGTKTGISITYQDGTGDMDFEVDHDAATNFAADEHYTQANIVATGTIASGVWQGTAIASAYLDADTAHLSVDQEITSKTQINKRKFSTVSASTGDCEGDIVYFGSNAASHVAGNIYTLNSSNQWVITDADATATSIGLLAVAMGTDVSSGMCIRGMANLNTTFAGSPSDGDILYLDGATAGAATGTAPTGNGDIVRVLGYKIGSGARMWFNPDNTFVEVTA